MIKKQLYRFYKFIKKPYNIILSVLLIVLGYLTLFPMLTMIKDTFTVHVSESMRLKQAAGSWTLNHWFKVLFDPSSLSVFYKPFFELSHYKSRCMFGCTFIWWGLLLAYYQDKYQMEEGSILSFHLSLDNA